MARKKQNQEEKEKKIEEKTEEKSNLESKKKEAERNKMVEEKQEIVEEKTEEKKSESENKEERNEALNKKEDTKNKEEKAELEREYIINLRKKIIKVPKYKRAKKAIRALREFLARHMKVEKRDTKKIVIDRYLNEEIWHRGIKKPLMKIKVKAKKIKGIVYAELAEMPRVFEFKKKKEEKFKQAKISTVEKKVEKEIEKKEDIETKEKEASTIEAGLKKQKKEAKEMKHRIKEKHKKTAPVRMALER